MRPPLAVLAALALVTGASADAPLAGAGQTSAAAGHVSVRTDGKPGPDPDAELVHDTEQTIADLIAESFPSLASRDIRVETFQSTSDYFRTSFHPWRFLFGLTMRYTVKVNPQGPVRGCPPEGVRAILAHELAHVDEMARGSRLRLLGLVRLLFRGPAATFERRADLRAISLGHGRGLQAYRRWLYDNVPASRLAEKRRNYFSPEEIDAILSLTSRDPGLIDHWIDHVPKSLDAILAGR